MAQIELRGNSGRRWAAVSIDGINGHRGLGFFRLVLQLTLQIDAADPTSNDQLVMLAADLQLPNGGVAGRMQPPPHQLPVKALQYNRGHNLQLELELDGVRLEAIEAARNGGDLNFILTVWAAFADGHGQPWLTNQQVQYLVNQGIWVRVLEEMGYRRMMLLEVPVPDGQASPELAMAANCLATAQQAMARGEYRSAVAQCRDVLEEIARALGVSDDSVDFNNLRQMDKATRLQLVRRALGILIAPAHHRKDPVAAAIEWSRTDATAVVSMTAAMLNQLEAPGARTAPPAVLARSAAK